MEPEQLKQPASTVPEPDGSPASLGLPRLNFPAIRLRMMRREGQCMVWDPLRKCYLVLTPEEWVRRHLIEYLTACCGAQPLRIVQEYPVPLNGMAQRADVVVVGDDGRPLLVAECKAAEVKIDRSVLAQVARYNAVLGARYVVLTNGMTHFCYAWDGVRYEPMSCFPQF